MERLKWVLGIKENQSKIYLQNKLRKNQQLYQMIKIRLFKLLIIIYNKFLG